MLLLLYITTKNIKNYKKIMDDAKKQQDYLNNSYKWCTNMTLYIDKYSSISFSLKKNTLLFNFFP